MNKQPHLKGKLLEIRPLHTDDFDALYKAASNGALAIIDPKTSEIVGINTGIQEIPVSYAPPKKSYVYKIEKPL